MTRERDGASAEARVGVKVRALRNERGLSQVDLARLLEDEGVRMHATSLAKLEVGTRPIRWNEMKALALALGVPVAALDDDPGEAERLRGMAVRRVHRLLREEASARQVLDRAEEATAMAIDDLNRVLAELKEARREAGDADPMKGLR